MESVDALTNTIGKYCESLTAFNCDSISMVCPPDPNTIMAAVCGDGDRPDDDGDEDDEDEDEGAEDADEHSR